MKYVYIVKSNYYGDHAQGNILGVHSSLPSARKHFFLVKTDRERRAELAWYRTEQDMAGAYLPKKYEGPSRELSSFYVDDKKNPEIVELLRWRVSCR